MCCSWGATLTNSRSGVHLPAVSWQAHSLCNHVLSVNVGMQLLPATCVSSKQSTQNAISNSIQLKMAIKHACNANTKLLTRHAFQSKQSMHELVVVQPAALASVVITCVAYKHLTRMLKTVCFEGARLALLCT